ncbi:MAG: carbohydrate kinase [Bacteroidales bacterium]|nr:carbohydrate kinase [Bacteroidales bacterium]
MYVLGFDVGSSSVKASLVDTASGRCVGSSFQPKQEMVIQATRPGWAEQDPELWWKYLKMALTDVLIRTSVDINTIKSIGISYQMHGLVLVDKEHKVLRPSIIWCDSRAVEIGNKAFEKIGAKQCLENMLNSPGNFTASKLMWIKENEPGLYRKIYKIMLPGDYIAMRMTGEVKTTISGLSEGILWNFRNHGLSEQVLKVYDIDPVLIPEIVPTFSVQGVLTAKTANELGLQAGTPVSYRAGDQPNNALSLNVLNPGEIAATAGTSGVVYGISDVIKYDLLSRVNTFAHVNHDNESTRLGVLLCVNGTGILNSWLRKNIAANGSYDEMNNLASNVNIGSDGLVVLPFGNGAERMLGNADIGSNIANINFNIHTLAHLLRAAQEGIVFAFKYGIEVMEGMGISPSVIRAGNANMFLSPVFRDTLSGITGSVIELYDTDGARGAAFGGGFGAGIYKSLNDALAGLKKLKIIEPDDTKTGQYQNAYERWKTNLETKLKN